MSNASKPQEQNGEFAPKLNVLQGGGESVGDGVIFSQDWGSPTDIYDILAAAHATGSPGGVVQVTIDRLLPTKLAENNDIQESIHKAIAAASEYYITEIWPTYPRGTADLDKIVELYDKTEEYENCSLLHTLRSLATADPHNAEKFKDAERIAQIIILNETADRQ